MASQSKMTLKTKKEIMIAFLLAVCMLLGVAVMVLVEQKVGTPIYYNGEMKNICVRINEICSSNRSIISDDSGEYPDYIELYNYGETFNLADFGLANDTNNSKVYSFGDITFEANSYLVIFLDGIEIPFRLSSDGNEYIALVAWDGTVIDSANTVKTLGDEVMLWKNGEFELSYEASPGYENTAEGAAQFKAGATDGSLSLAINEILTSNGSALPDFEGEFCDIIEIKNVSPAIVSTKGYYISDDMKNRARFALPERTLAPGDILLVFASGKDTVAENGEIHSDFRISDGEEIVLSVGSKYVTQKAVYCENNCSLSRVQGDNGYEYVKMLATPGYENDESGKEALEAARIDTAPALVISELLLSQDLTAYGGKLRDVIEICNISDKEVSTKGWFVSDSEEDPYKYALPEKTLMPNECIVLYAENGSGENLCGFALSSGESVYMTTPEYKRSEYISCISAGRGNSRSYSLENGVAVYTDGAISIGFANSEAGIASYEAAVRPSDIEISEVVSSNTQYLAGPYKTYHDFIELHNRTDNDITLDGYFLSDDPEQPRKAGLDGVVIPANSYIAVILSSEGQNVPLGYTVLPFGINASGETLVLSRGDYILDSAPVPSLAPNTAYGRADGENGFSVLASVTPEKANSKRATEKTASPQSSLGQGVYGETVTIELTGEGNIYYTLDCTEPNADSTRYTSPITVSKTTVIRCIAIESGKLKSEVADLTFIVNENDSLEAISIVTEPKNLFDYYTGIYETGPRASSVFPYEGANYYNRWEREASVNFFAENDEGFYENCGIRIFGGLSRSLPKKSFALFFRSAYGSDALYYQLFEDSELDSETPVRTINTPVCATLW